MPKVIDPVPRFNYHDKKEVSSYIIAIFRYRYKGKNVILRYSTGLKIEKKFWIFGTNEPKTHTSTNEAKSFLNGLRKTILEVYKQTNGNISPQEFKNELDYRLNKAPRPEQEKQILDFLGFFKFFIEQKEKKLRTGEISEKTIKQFKSIFSKVERYCQHTGEELTLEGINSTFRQDFTEWCFNEEKNATNTVHKYLKKIKQVVKEAREKGLTGNNYPETTDWKLKKAPTTSIALSETEREAIFRLDLKSHSEGYQSARQLFLIGAYTGLRVSDVIRIQPAHIVTENGVSIIRITPQKTNRNERPVQVSIPIIEPNLKAVLEECKYQAPKLEEPTLNRYIKEIAKLAGITEERIIIDSKGGKLKEVTKPKYELIASHTARKTYATISIAKGLPARTVMTFTGHSTEQQLNTYIDQNTLHAMLEYQKLYGN